MRKITAIFLLMFLFLNIIPFGAADSGYKTAVIYYNEACTMCAMYVEKELIPTLEEAGIKNIIKKDYINEKQNRAELNEINEKHNIPPTLQGQWSV